MNMSEFSDSLYFEKGFDIRINNKESELFIYADYDTRSEDLNMVYQHFHDFYEILIPLDSGVSHLVDGRLISLEAGDMLFLRPHMLHMSIYPKGAESRRIIIDFSLGDSLSSLMHQKEKMLSPFTEAIPVLRLDQKGLHSDIAEYLNKLFISGKVMKQGWQIEAYSALLMFLVAASREMRNNRYTEKEEARNAANKMYQIAEYIQAHSSEILTLPMIAERFSISPYYLSHQFPAVFGISLTKHLQIVRVRNALQMLGYTGSSIHDVIQNCGFSSASQFSRIFRAVCSMSPSEFRNLSPQKKEILISSITPETYEKAGIGSHPHYHVMPDRTRKGAGRTIAIESYALKPDNMEELKRRLDIISADSVIIDIPVCFPSVESYKALMHSPNRLNEYKALRMNISILGYTPPDDSYSDIAECIAALDAAAELSAPVLTISPKPSSDGKGFQRLMDFLVAVIPEAIERNVILTTGPKKGTAIPDASSMLKILDFFPDNAIKALLSPMDLAECNGGENTFTFFDEMFSSFNGRISALMLKDSIDGVRVNLGHGKMARTYPRISALLTDEVPLIRAGSSALSIADDLDYIKKIFL